MTTDPNCTSGSSPGFKHDRPVPALARHSDAPFHKDFILNNFDRQTYACVCGNARQGRSKQMKELTVKLVGQTPLLMHRFDSTKERLEKLVAVLGPFDKDFGNYFNGLTGQTLCSLVDSGVVVLAA